MSESDELKIRANAESAVLAQFLQLAMNNAVKQAGDIAVLTARVAELTPKPKK